MKVILSRKGFDSANGCMPSPLFPDGRLVSFPIPSWGDRYRYKDLKISNGLGYDDMLAQLGPDNTVFYGCHADPDLSWNRFAKKPRDWRPGFGQINQAQSYLNHNGVGLGDLFLFFGIFKDVEFVDGSWRYVRGAAERHIIWGYLQVGRIARTAEEQHRWFPYHAHENRYDEHSAIYGATSRLSFLPSMKGAGLLDFSEKRVLTKDGCSKAVWKWNEVYAPKNVCSDRKNSAKGRREIFYSGIWQELCLKETKDAERWAKGVLK